MRHVNFDAEESVVGAPILAACTSVEYGHAVLERIVGEGVDEHSFASASHQRIFACLLAMWDRELPLDPISVAHELRDTGSDAFTRGRLEIIARGTVYVSSAEHHARIVRELAGLRALEGART